MAWSITGLAENPEHLQSGIERVLGELERDDLALLCAEEDPLNCHRFLMICPELVAMGIEPVHIRKGGVERNAT